jgi:hypothetical protein
VVGEGEGLQGYDVERSAVLMAVKHPTYDEIAARAQQVYLASGCKPGHDLDNWLQAEYELMQLPVRELAKRQPPKPSGNRPKHKSIVEVVRAAIV